MPRVRPLNILQITSGTAVNGAVLYCKYLSERLAKRGHDVTLMLRKDACLLEQKIDGVATVVSTMSRSPFELARMVEWVRENRIDVIHTHMTRAHTFGVLLRMITGVPVVATGHSCSFQLHWPFNDFVIANSDSTCDYHRRVNRVAADRIKTVYCYSDLERFLASTPMHAQLLRENYRVDSEDFLVVMVGEVTRRKGQEYLFDAIPDIVAKIPNFKLWILGSANREMKYVQRLRAFQLHHRLFGRIRWMGLRSDVQRHFQAADLCVVPSLEEPLGLVAVESLASGTAVVASCTGGLPEIVHDQKFGRLVPSKDATQLAEAIIEMAQDRERCKAYGQAGKRFVAEQFDPKVLTDQVEDVLKRVAKKKF